MLFPGRRAPEADTPAATLPLPTEPRSTTPAAPGPVPSRKQERSAHREQLYAVVRECMLRAGVLSSGYKFKVLSLDGHGRSFLVMMDILAGAQAPADPAAVEEAIGQAARQRNGIEVEGVYWRSVAARAEAAAAPAEPATASPSPLQALREAFRDRDRDSAAASGEAGHGPRSYTLLTGFEDTEISPAAQRSGGPLGNTQYGEP